MVDRSSRFASAIAGLIAATSAAPPPCRPCGQRAHPSSARRRPPAAARPSVRPAADARNCGGRHLAGRDDDPRAHLGPVPHLHGKGHRHADAAMRRRIARQHAGMHRDARPGDPLHERHRRAAIDVGVVQLLFLNDAEDAHRRRMAVHARGNRRFREESVGVVDLQLLLVDRDRDDQRSLRLGRFLSAAPRSFWPDGREPLPPLRNRAVRAANTRDRNPTSNRARLPRRRWRRSPRPPSKRQFAKAVRSQSEALMPAHAHHPRIPSH